MLQLKLECGRAQVEELTDLLEATGALSVTLTDQQDEPILEPEIGTTPLWAQVVIQALYEDNESSRTIKEHLQQHYPGLHFNWQTLEAKNWERVCLDDFRPLQFGKRLWVCPSWLPAPDPTAINLTLDPGLAFGTGTHQTTSLCLQWLEQADLANKSLIDYGCGSGILALAAVKLGAKEVFAVDIDPQALTATQNNAEMNQLPDSLTIDFPDNLHTKVDIVIANILLDPLLSLKSRLYTLLKHQGILVVSGILAEQMPSLCQAYEDHFSMLEHVILQEWGLIAFQTK